MRRDQKQHDAVNRERLSLASVRVQFERYPPSRGVVLQAVGVYTDGNLRASKINFAGRLKDSACGCIDIVS